MTGRTRREPTPPSASHQLARLVDCSAARVPVPAPPGPYRSQSNDPVRRGVLPLPNCVRLSPGLRRYRSRRAVRPGIRSLVLKELPHGQNSCSRHVRRQGRCSLLQTLCPLTPIPSRMEPETCLALDPETIQLLFILRSKRFQYFFAQRFRVLYFEK